MHRLMATNGLPAEDDDIGVFGIEFHQPGATTAGLGGDQGGAAAAEEVEHEVALLGRIQQGVAHQRHRLDGGVHGPFARLVGAKPANPVIGPDV